MSKLATVQAQNGGDSCGLRRRHESAHANRWSAYSLFPHEVFFENLKAEDCIRLLAIELEKIDVSVPFLKDVDDDGNKNFLRLLMALSLSSAFGNAKDITILAKDMEIALFKKLTKPKKSLLLRGKARRIPTLPALTRDLAIASERYD